VSVVFAAVAPHGGIAIREACAEDERDLAVVTQDGLAELGRRFAAAAPEAAVIFTPHNVHVEGTFAVVVAAWLEGDGPVPLRVPCDRELALRCLAALREAGLPAAGVSFGGNDPIEAEMPLDWGALIPLWYMRGAPVVLVCPARELDAEAHAAAGQAIAAAVDGRRVAIIASADNGHAHDPDGPYGYDPAAAEYDELVCGALRENRLGGLLGLDPAFVERARADSWWQLLMLHGALEGTGLEAELVSYEAPTYFGMACAAWEPVRQA
jgi:aromatic ring-opening dioxygenase LigB subunit